jgi:hypothetical protein
MVVNVSGAAAARTPLLRTDCPQDFYPGAVVRDLSFSTRGGLRRVPGGLAALSIPLILATIALSADFKAAGGERGVAVAVLGVILFLMAAPTTWIFAIDFIEAGRLTVVLVGLLTSLPLWYLLGVRLAISSTTWLEFARRYLTVCILVAFATLFVIEVFGSI